MRNVSKVSDAKNTRQVDDGAVTESTRRRAARSDSGFPESLPGFDVAGAAARLNGNRKLLGELLLRFAAEHCDCTETVKRALAALRPGEAAAILHRLKGAATVVGANDVAESAATVERHVLHGTPASLEPLQDAMCRAIALIHANVAVGGQAAAGSRPGTSATGDCREGGG